ncbi:MAG: hypothetical protein IRZ14_02660 [Chloroflexi bacterium]|nr:hypothetical protein [Chloroflexota bacterium]
MAVTLRPPKRPRAIDVAMLGFALLVLLQLLVGALLVLHRAEVIETTRRAHPEWAGAAVEQTANGTVYGGLAVHLVLAVLYAWLGLRCRDGSVAARSIASVLFVLGIAAGLGFVGSASAVLPNEVPYVIGEQVVSTLLRLGTLLLLWVPPEARTFFARRPTPAS